MEDCLDWSRLPHVCGVCWEIRSVGKLIDSMNDLLVTRLVIRSSSRATRDFFREFIARLLPQLRHIPKRVGNKISHAHVNMSIWHFLLLCWYFWSVFNCGQNTDIVIHDAYRHKSKNAGIFIRFATVVFATSGQSFIRLKIASNML